MKLVLGPRLGVCPRGQLRRPWRSGSDYLYSRGRMPYPNGFDQQKKAVWKNWKKCQNLVKPFGQFQNKNK